MSWASVVAARLRGLFGHKRLERELDDEVRFHLEMQIEDNLKAGMNPAEARYAALRSFGGIEPMKERYRERRAFALVETMTQDVRYAVRTLRKSPGFTTTSVATLALAIGANTAMFSVLNAVLLRPLPYRSPEQLAMLWSEVPSQNLREGRSAYWNVEQWRSQSESFADMALFDGVSSTLTSADRAEKISVVRHSPNLFPLLGVQPLHGRIFSAEEAEQRQRVALISHRFWQGRFGGSFDAIGSSIELDGLPSRIIGSGPGCRASSGKACAGLWRDDPGKSAWRLPQRASLPDLAPHRILRGCAPDGRHRDLRAHPVLRRDAHTRDRHPHGRRRTGRRRLPHDNR